MTDPKATEPTLNSFGDLPMQPTGSGVADLQIAYEQRKLSEAADLADGQGVPATGDTVTVDGLPAIPTEAGDDALESAAHPS